MAIHRPGKGVERRPMGFSVVEALAVVALAAILIAVSLPMASQFFATYKLSEAAEGVASELQAARLMAVTRNDQTQVQFLDASGNATLSPSQARGLRVTDNSSPEPVKLRDDYMLHQDVTFEKLPLMTIKFGSRGELIVPSGGYSEESNSIELVNASGSIEIRVSSSGRIKIVDRRASQH